MLVLLLLETQKASLIHKVLFLIYSILIGSWFAQIGLVGLSNEENIYIAGAMPLDTKWWNKCCYHVTSTNKINMTMLNQGGKLIGRHHKGVIKVNEFRECWYFCHPTFSPKAITQIVYQI